MNYLLLSVVIFSNVIVSLENHLVITERENKLEWHYFLVTAIILSLEKLFKMFF